MAIPPPPPEQPWNQPRQPGGGPPPRQPAPPAPQAYGTSPQAYGTSPQAYGSPQGPYGSSHGPYGPQPFGGGAQPYPGGPQPFGVPAGPPATNGLAIASLVTGIVCCVPPLGLILGLVALSQIRKRGDAGKGLAVAGVVLSSLSVVLVLVGLLTGVFEDFKKGFSGAARDRGDSNRSSVQQLRIGQCFDTPAGSLEGRTSRVTIIDCAKPHDAELFGTFVLAESTEYPGEGEIGTIADERCPAAEAEYTGGVAAESDSYHLMPDPRAWRRGERVVSCVFSNQSGEKLTGSLRDSGTDAESGGDTGDGSDGGTDDGPAGGTDDGPGSSTGGGSSGGSGAGEAV